MDITLECEEDAGGGDTEDGQEERDTATEGEQTTEKTRTAEQGTGRVTGVGPEDDTEMDELMAATAAGTSAANESTELEIEEWEEVMARDADDEEWWRRPDRVDDG